MNTITQIIKARQAVSSLSGISDEVINNVLIDLADRVDASTENLLAANKIDLDRISNNDIKYDKIKLSKKRIANITNKLREVACEKSLIGEVIEERNMPSGIELKKVRVPIGLIGIVYEACPSLTFNMFALCFKSRNGVVLKGGTKASFSDQSIESMIKKSLIKNGVSPEIIQLLSPEHESVAKLMNATGLIDLLIARGSQDLINLVRINSKVPVIEIGAGVVHIYFDKSGDIETGRNIIFNSKTHDIHEFSSLECLLIHSERLNILPDLLKPLSEKQINIEADHQAYETLEDMYPKEYLHVAKGSSFGTEFIDYRMAVKTVDSIDEAINHIGTYGSKLSEAIVATDDEAIKCFFNEVDAAAIYANTSTAFTNSEQFGMGLGVGISTQKFHVRGPIGLKELTSYKWLVNSDGKVRC